MLSTHSIDDIPNSTKHTVHSPQYCKDVPSMVLVNYLFEFPVHVVALLFPRKVYRIHQNLVLLLLLHLPIDMQALIFKPGWQLEPGKGVVVELFCIATCHLIEVYQTNTNHLKSYPYYNTIRKKNNKIN